MARPKHVSYKACVRQMRSKNGLVSEEAFLLLQEHAHRFVDELIADYQAETNTSLKYWFLELVCAARRPSTIGFLVEQLDAPEDGFRPLVIDGLRKMGDREATEALVRAGIDPTQDPWES